VRGSLRKHFHTSICLLLALHLAVSCQRVPRGRPTDKRKRGEWTARWTSFFLFYRQILAVFLADATAWFLETGTINSSGSLLNCKHQPRRHSHATEPVTKIQHTINRESKNFIGKLWFVVLFLTGTSSWHIAVCNLVLVFQDASNKKSIQDVDVELCFCNFYSQTVIDDLS